MSSEHEQQQSRLRGEQTEQPSDEPWTDLELTIPHNRSPTAIVSLVECALVELTHEDVGAEFVSTSMAGVKRTQFIAAVGRRETDADIDTYIDRHGVAGLATALTYAVARELGEVTHRLMAEDLDISPLAAEMILQALCPVVREHYAIEEAGAGLDELDIDDGDAADDA